MDTGSEVITGSTRMNAGTATKQCLNFLSTALMVRLGLTRGPHMIHLACLNDKLLHRALEGSLWEKYQRRFSLLKLIGFLAATPANLLWALASLCHTEHENFGFHNALLHYCCYDRQKRKNLAEILWLIFPSFWLFSFAAEHLRTREHETR